MFSNVQFLTMEDNSFTALKKEQKKNKKSFYTWEHPVLYSKFEEQPPNSHPLTHFTKFCQ